MRPVKQVIVMRADLKMTIGKAIAQGAHASVGSLCAIGEKLLVSVVEPDGK